MWLCYRIPCGTDGFALRFYFLSVQLSEEPAFRLAPLPHHGDRGDFQHFCRLFDRKSTEESQFYYAALARIELCQLVQSIIQRDYVGAPSIPNGQCLVERDLPDNTLFVMRPLAREIDQYASHQLRGHSQEVGAILPPRRLPVYQPN